MGTDGDVTQTMMDGYPLVSPKLLPLHVTRCRREVRGRGRRSSSTRAGDSGVKRIISSVLMLHSLLIPGPKPEKEALGYSLRDTPLPIILTFSLPCHLLFPFLLFSLWAFFYRWFARIRISW